MVSSRVFVGFPGTAVSASMGQLRLRWYLVMIFESDAPGVVCCTKNGLKIPWHVSWQKDEEPL